MTVLSTESLEKNSIQVLEGGWISFKTAFEQQKVFKEERKFFQALSFIKRVEICQSMVKGKQQGNTADNLVLKLTQALSTPRLSFNIRDSEVSEVQLKKLIDESIFRNHIK